MSDATKELETIRLTVDFISQIPEKRLYCSQLFDVSQSAVEMFVKGEFTVLEDGVYKETIDVRTFRKVKAIKGVGGVVNRRIKIEVDGADTWVTTSWGGPKFDLMLEVSA